MPIEIVIMFSLGTVLISVGVFCCGGCFLYSLTFFITFFVLDNKLRPQSWVFCTARFSGELSKIVVKQFA